ncbi:MAG: PrsW family glutamic-type intramembrane protease [Verrucomicrobiales bacterium]|nr:PrsW family intramembrane metalloprotease [Verrucomicrobiales bacterium]
MRALRSNGLWLAVFTLCALLLVWTEDWPKFARGLGVALIPGAIWVCFVLSLNRGPGLPAQYLVKSMLWGGIVATFLASKINLLTYVEVIRISRNSGLFDGETPENLGYLAGLVVSAPVGEEGLKGLIVVMLLGNAARPVTGVWQGVLLGSLSAICFGLTENAFQFSSPTAGPDGSGFMKLLWSPRLASPMMHALFTLPLAAMAGWAALLPTLSQRVAAITAGWAVSSILHGACNWFFFFSNSNEVDWAWATAVAIPVLPTLLFWVRNLERRSLFRHGLTGSNVRSAERLRLASLRRLDQKLTPTPEEAAERARLEATLC